MPEKTENILIVINDSPYGNERPYNALRLALNLVKKPEMHVCVSLIGDGVNCAIGNQKTPEGYYNVEKMIHSLAQRGEVFTRGSCLDARGLGLDRLVEGVQRGSMDVLGAWAMEVDKVLVF